MVDPATDDAVTVAVELTLRQHQGDGTSWRPGACRQCLPDGTCKQLAWAIGERQRLTAPRPGAASTPAQMTGGNRPAAVPKEHDDGSS